MLRKFLVVVGIWALSGLAWANCAEAVIVKLATVAPEGSSWMTEMRKGAEEIKRRTDGRVAIKFFGGGVMGNDNSVLRKIRAGQLHGGAFTSGGLSEVCPSLQVYGLPLVFRSYTEVDYVRSRMDPLLLADLEKAGFVSFGLAGGGFAMLMSRDPIASLEDMKKKTIWIPADDRISEVTMKYLGLSPVSLPLTDVLTGLQTGLLDVVATSPVGAIAFQWHVKTRYITDTPLAYLFATLVIDKKVFNAFSPADQQVVREVRGKIYKGFEQQNRIDDQAAAKALTKQGMQTLTPAKAELAQWQAKAEEVNAMLEKEGAFPAPLYKQLKKLVSECRK